MHGDWDERVNHHIRSYIYCLNKYSLTEGSETNGKVLVKRRKKTTDEHLCENNMELWLPYIHILTQKRKLLIRFTHIKVVITHVLSMPHQ